MPELPPSEPQKRQEPTHSGIEVSGDTHGNLKFTFPATPLQETALHGRQHTTAIITPEGLSLLKQEGVDRKDIVERVAGNRLTTAFGKVGSGAEGVVREVSSAKGHFERLFSSDGITALRKDIVPDRFGSSMKAAGWETVELFDVIRPAFDAHGYRLLTLYGATPEQVFMPKLSGKKLIDREAEIQTKGNDIGMTVSEAFEAQTLPLYQDTLVLLTAHMEKLGFHRDPKWQFEDYLQFSTPPSFLDENENERVFMNIDFATTMSLAQRRLNWKRGDVPSNFDSWIVEDPHIVDTVLALGQNGNIEGAVDALKKASICYDPLFVTKRDRIYELTR